VVIQDKLPLTPRARAVIIRGYSIGKRLKQNFVGTEHLLFGFLDDPECCACHVFKMLGVELSDIEQTIAGLMGCKLAADAPHAQDSGSLIIEPDVVLERTATGHSKVDSVATAPKSSSALRRAWEYEVMVPAILRDGSPVADEDIDTISRKL